MLLGLVNDPIFGALSATSHVDFSPEVTGTLIPALTGAELHLKRNYIYGDTTSMITVAVHDILDSWNPAGATADTTLMLGPEITTHTFLSADTLVTIPMPMEWVSTYEDTLRSVDIDSLFHGLALVPIDGQSVVGFGNQGTSLQLHSTDDTTGFLFQREITTISRQTAPMLPDDLVGVQDGAGPTVHLQFDLESMANQPINGAVLVLHADTLAVRDAPEHFVRPIVQELQLVAVREDGGPALLVGQVRMSEEGIFSFFGEDMATFFYGVLFGTIEYDYLQLRVPVLDNTLNGLLLHDTSSEDRAPVLRFILGI